MEEKSERQVLKYLKESCKVEVKVAENTWIGQELMSLRETEHYVQCFQKFKHVLVKHWNR